LIAAGDHFRGRFDKIVIGRDCHRFAASKARESDKIDKCAAK
jgi:hypothetical protein